MTANKNQRPTWTVINLDNLAFNFHSVKRFIGSDVEYMAVVKADAYGHGAIECSKRLETEGVNWFGVAIAEEGVEVRHAGIRIPILCLGGFWHGQEQTILEHDLSAVIFSVDMARELNKIASENGLTAKVHVKIDTGMGRIGIRNDQIFEFIDKLKTFKNLELEGIMTHFAVADDLTENEFTNMQIQRFNASVNIFENNGFYPKYRDLANSPGAIVHKQGRGNLVRLGGVLYGLGGDVLPAEIEKPELKPVLSLRSRIAQLKFVSKGEALGYGKTFTTGRDSLIATIPIGYHDGLPRLLSNRGFVIVNGVLVPIAGRISMDWTIIDVTEVPNVMVNDEVIVVGSDREILIKAEDIAREVSTISYEITCGINRRVVRKFVGEYESN